MSRRIRRTAAAPDQPTRARVGDGEAVLKASTFGEFGSTGLNQWGGFIREEFLTDLIGQRGMRMYREMSDNDDILGACLFAIERLAGQVDWRVEAADEAERTEQDEKDEKVKFLEECLFEDMDRPWSETVNEALSMLAFGYAPLEICYKRRSGPKFDDTDPMGSRYTDGRIGWAKWSVRSQETIYRWDFDESSRKLKGLVQKTLDQPEAYIPAQKLLLFRTSSRRGNPEGRSVLRNAYIDYFFKRRIKEVEGIGIERDLAGLPVLTGKENEDLWNPNDPLAAAKLAAAQKLVTGIRVDEQMGVVLPFGYTLELLGGQAGGKKIDVNAVITRYDQRMAMTMLADFILIGHDQVGSKALASTKVLAFGKALTSFLDRITDVVNRIAIPRLWKLNGWPVENLPRLTHSEVEDVDLEKLGTYIFNLSRAGVPLLPNPRLEAFLHDAAKLPAPAEGFEERARVLAEQEAEQAQAEADMMQQELDIQREGVQVKAGKQPAAGAGKSPAKTAGTKAAAGA